MSKDYGTVSGHLKGEPWKAFLEAIKESSGQSRFVAEAVTEKLIRDGWLEVADLEIERERITKAIKGLPKVSKALAEKVLDLLAQVERETAKEVA